MKFILSIRYYYILSCVGKKYGLWIFNPKCMVVPHFPLDNESCIFVLQCRDHTQGNLKNDDAPMQTIIPYYTITVIISNVP